MIIHCDLPVRQYVGSLHTYVEFNNHLLLTPFGMDSITFVFLVTISCNPPGLNYLYELIQFEEPVSFSRGRVLSGPE